ncbi:Dcp1-like decapping family protein [Babesia ovis]|uniref:Dcp1-like decapping family protein n=1 Tax=Babesia ovis TaxID=5869 RepID=A0A9W5T9P5_BABOV|nr:Dcp1-like decapping family protein [Babesia ovis]
MVNGDLGDIPSQYDDSANSAMDQVKRMRGRLSLKMLSSLDEHVKNIIFQTPFVTAYELKGYNEWVRAEIEGFLYILQRNVEPYNSIILVNRKSENHLIEYITPEFQVSLDGNFIFYRSINVHTRTHHNIRGLWFFDKNECKNTFEKLLSVTINREPLSGFQPAAEHTSVISHENKMPSAMLPSDMIHSGAAQPLSATAGLPMPIKQTPSDYHDPLDIFNMKKKEGFVHPGVNAHQRTAPPPTQVPLPSVSQMPAYTLGPAVSHHQQPPATMSVPHVSTNPVLGFPMPDCNKQPLAKDSHTLSDTSRPILGTTNQSHTVYGSFPLGTQQVFIVGPEGRGKTTLIKDLIRHGTSKSPNGHHYSYYNFESNANHNFQVMVTRWTSSLISQHPLIKVCGEQDCINVYNELEKAIPQLKTHIRTFLNRILTLKHLDRQLANHLRDIIASNNEITGQLWYDTCSLILKHAPATMGIYDHSEVRPAEAFFYGLFAVGIIAEKAEIECRNLSNPSSRLTATWASKYVIQAFSVLSQLHKQRWIMCLDGIHELTRSPFLFDRGTTFLRHLLAELQANRVSALFISDDSMSSLAYYNKQLSRSIDRVYSDLTGRSLSHGTTPPDTRGDASVLSNASRDTSILSDVSRDCLSSPNPNVDVHSTLDTQYAVSIDSSSVVHFHMPEIEPSVSRGILKEDIHYSDAIARALVKVCGGNLGLINTIVVAYKDLENNLDLPAVHQILAGSESPVDDEYFPLNASAEQQAEYLHEERCRMFVRNVHNLALPTEIIKFENMINRFLSLPLMESINHKFGDNLHFMITVNETIRHLLSKPLLQLKSGPKIDNKIVLSLLASGIIHYNTETSTLEFKNSLTKILLEAYVDNYYESLPLIDQLKYKANYLLNQRKIYQETDRMLI